MSIISLIEAIHAEKVWLGRQVIGLLPVMTPPKDAQEAKLREVHYPDWQITQAIRIEVDHDGLDMIWQAAQHDRDLAYQMRQSDEPGPVSFHGYDLYEVRSLPEPHWRVINSLRKR